MAITNTVQTAITGSSYTVTLSFDANTNYIGTWSNITVNPNGTVATHFDYVTAPDMGCINYFTPVAGKRYKVTYTLKRTSQYDPSTEATLRPGFIYYMNSADPGVIIGPTFGEGLISPFNLVDTASWAVGREYKVGTIYSWDAPVPQRVYPRMRINRNVTDASPYSNATFLITAVSVDPEIKFSELENEYTGNSVPVKLSLLHRTVQLTKGDGYIVDNSSDFNTVVNSLANITISQADVFNTWQRFGNGGVLYANVSAAPIDDEARSWLYDSNTNQVVSTINSTNPIGFISPANYISYTHSVTVSSVNADDDVIGLVVASIANAGIVRNIIAWRSQGGNGLVWGFMDKGPAQAILANGSASIAEADKNVANAVANSTNQGWSSYGPVNIKVVKNGKTITAWTTQKGNTVLDANTMITYTIPDDSVFADATPYGYFAYSQLSATFSNIAFSGGLNDYIFDYTLPNNKKVYEKSSNTWVVNSSLTAESILGSPRIISNPLTGKVFSVDSSGYVEDISKNKTIPIVGEVSISDFYGSEDCIAPVFTTAAGSLGSVTHGAGISIQINVTDHSGDALRYSIGGGPTGLTISSSGLLGGSIASAGTYNFTVYVYNINKVASRNFSLTVT